MDTRCNSMMGIKLNCRSVLATSERNLANGCGVGNMCNDIIGPSNVDVTPADEGDNPLPRDHFDAVLRYLNQMLMEEDLEQRPCMYQDLLALQAAEKSFYDALTGKDHSSTNATLTFAVDKSSGNQVSKHLTSTVSSRQNKIFPSGNNPMGSSLIPPEGNYESFQIQNSVANPQITRSDLQSFGPLTFSNKDVRGLMDCPNSTLEVLGSSTITEVQRKHNSRGEQTNITAIRYRENDGHLEERGSKQFASYAEEFDPIEIYDKVLLCPSGNPGFYTESPSCPCDEKPASEDHKQFVLPDEPKRGRPRAGERKPNIREVVDLRGLLTQCAQSVAIYDNRTAHELLNRIRQHCSPYGDATERLAHCFANALEARISGMGTTLYTAISTRRVSAAETLRAYQSYVLACPFKRMSNIFADKSIGKLTRGASTIHIIDFGILYGFQWPCIIQGVSLRPEGPPNLRITGIDLPQPGFRPAERVEETGRRLERYCKRFNVPFEYRAIAKKWETIRVEELMIKKGEAVVVNCLYRLRHVPDETAESSSPRDAVLDLIKKIKPDYFIHGVLNGSYYTPFFVTRFRDALYHFSSLFDMFENTLPREDQDRFLFEKEVLGREVMNVIACEGTERVERPETYKQWQVRNQRAGFTQLPLIQEIVREVRAKVKLRYHKDFLVDEDSNWILQGWKGRVIYAISCWKPNQK